VLAIDYLVRFGDAVADGLGRPALSVICVERAGAARHLRGGFALWSEVMNLLDRKFCSKRGSDRRIRPELFFVAAW
jgi:hypothetical protein|tara:strand:+ start:615 stop:842 length:228 start_codon:yes stop_codon:yes gene_type:complete